MIELEEALEWADYAGANVHTKRLAAALREAQAENEMLRTSNRLLVERAERVEAESALALGQDRSDSGKAKKLEP